MDREQLFDRLLDAFLALKQSFEQQIESIDDRIVQIRLEYLRQLYEERQKELADWLGEIDQSLIDCCAYIQEYQRLCEELGAISGKILQLARASPPRDAPLPADSIEGVILARLQHLRGEGKI